MGTVLGKTLTQFSFSRSADQGPPHPEELCSSCFVWFCQELAHWTLPYLKVDPGPFLLIALCSVSEIYLYPQGFNKASIPQLSQG